MKRYILALAIALGALLVSSAPAKAGFIFGTVSVGQFQTGQVLVDEFGQQFLVDSFGNVVVLPQEQFFLGINVNPSVTVVVNQRRFFVTDRVVERNFEFQQNFGFQRNVEFQRNVIRGQRNTEVIRQRTVIRRR